MTTDNVDNVGLINDLDPESLDKDLELQKEIDNKYEFCRTTPTYVRHDFIKKVFGIVFLQLLYLFSYTLITYNIPQVRIFYQTYPISVHFFAAFYVLSILILSCFPNFCKNKEVSIICLCTLTPILGFVLGGYCSIFTSKEIGIAIGLTLATIAILLIISFQTKYDFTKWIFPVMIVSINIFVIWILTIFIRNRIKQLIFAGLALVLSSLYLIIDVQMIIGGNHRYMFTIDDYMFASLCVTTDIINIFMEIMRFVRF